MRVLIFSPFFYPEPISTGRYNTVLAQELVRSGASVEVFASHPMYPDWRPERSAAQLPGMRIYRGGAWMRYPIRQVLRRLLLESWYAAYVTWSLILRRPRADRVVVIFPPMLLAPVVRCLVPKSVPMTGIVHDLQGVMARNRWVRAAAHWMEKRALATCDRLVFLSHSMANRAISEYGLDRSRSVVRYPFTTLAGQEPAGDQLVNVLPERFLHVVYSGALGEKQEPEKLYELLRALAAADPQLRCHIFSAGPHFERLRAAADTTTKEVAFHDLVPEDVLGELYARSAIQIVPQASGTGDGAIPSKIPNLLAAGVPVFVVSDPESEATILLSQAGASAGCCVSSYDAPETHIRFQEFLGQVREQSREDRIRRQRPFVEQLFGVGPVVADILQD